MSSKSFHSTGTRTVPIYETRRHYIIKTPKAYEVYRHEGTAAVKCATIGLSLGFDRAKAELEKREK